MKNPSSRILGTGRYLPTRVVTSEELAPRLNTTEDWIVQRSGIRERRYAGEGDHPSTMGTRAAVLALQAANLKPDDVDFLICATQTPEYLFPGTGCVIHEQLGLRTVGALDIRTQCTGFLYGLSLADAYVRLGIYKNVLLVCTELHSRGLEFNEAGRNVTMLFGDGAGAVVVGASKSRDEGLLGLKLHADGRFAKDLVVEAPGFTFDPWCSHELIDQGKHLPQMNGRSVFKEAVSSMRQVIKDTLSEVELTIDQMDHIVPHQANKRINEAVVEPFHVPVERINYSVEYFGNTGAASVPIALDEWVREGRIKTGDLCLIPTFAAGFTWGGAVMRW